MPTPTPPTPIEELTARFLQSCGEAGESEKRVVERLTQRLHISRNTHQDFEQSLTLGQRLADRVAGFGGSWTFIITFLVGLVLIGVDNAACILGVSREFRSIATQHPFC